MRRRFLGSETPLRSSMTTFADCKIIAAECALAIVAAHAALTARPCVMIQRYGRGNLPSLRHSCSDLMALVTTDFLMSRMIKAYAESLCEFSSALVAA